MPKETRSFERLLSLRHVLSADNLHSVSDSHSDSHSQWITRHWAVTSSRLIDSLCLSSTLIRLRRRSLWWWW